MADPKATLNDDPDANAPESVDFSVTYEEDDIEDVAEEPQEAKRDEPAEHKAARDGETATAVSQRIDHELRGRRKFDASVFRTYPVYAFNNVSVTDKKSGAEVLENVSFGCQAGRAYAVLVPDDAPLMRTMLLSVMAGVTLPTKGHVMTKSTSFAELSPLEIRGYRLGLLMQQFSFRRDLDAEDNIVYAMDASNRNFLKPKPILARELLAMVGFGTPAPSDNAPADAGSAGSAEAAPQAPVPTKGVKAADLSLIDQHRLAVARAICRDPDVLIADEPTATLNDEDGKEILALIKAQTRSHSKKRAVIVVTSSEQVAHTVGNIIDLR